VGPKGQKVARGPDRQRRLKRRRDTTKFLKVSLIGTAQLFADDCDCVSALSPHFFFLQILGSQKLEQGTFHCD